MPRVMSRITASPNPMSSHSIGNYIYIFIYYIGGVSRTWKGC